MNACLLPPPSQQQMPPGGFSADFRARLLLLKLIYNKARRNNTDSGIASCHRTDGRLQSLIMIVIINNQQSTINQGVRQSLD
jgi:hypothetical protein